MEGRMESNTGTNFKVIKNWQILMMMLILGTNMERNPSTCLEENLDTYMGESVGISAYT